MVRRPDHARAGRLLDVTRELETAARARLAGVQADAAAVAQAREDLLGALGADHPLSGLFAAARARRLAALAAEAQRLAATQAACAQELVALEGRRRLCERMLEAAGAALRREEEARQLDDVISRHAARPAASPG
jgi:hypothetical protein